MSSNYDKFVSYMYFEEYNNNILLDAIMNNDTMGVINLLKDSNTIVHPKYPNKYNTSPLHMALKKENYEIVKLLLKHKADPNLPDISNYKPIHLASKIRNTKFLNLLLEFGADPNIQNGYGKTPLFIASREGNIESVLLLIKYGANLFEPNIYNTFINGHYEDLTLWKILKSNFIGDQQEVVKNQIIQAYKDYCDSKKHSTIESVVNVSEMVHIYIPPEIQQYIYEFTIVGDIDSFFQD